MYHVYGIPVNTIRGFEIHCHRLSSRRKKIQCPPLRQLGCSTVGTEGTVHTGVHVYGPHTTVTAVYCVQYSVLCTYLYSST